MNGAAINFFDLGLTNPVWRTITATNAAINSGGQLAHTNVLNGGIQMDGVISSRPNNAVMIINGIMSGNASYNISAGGTGRLFLNGANTYTGDTTVTNGTLGGSGVIPSNLTVLGGTLAPGWPVGPLTVNGNVVINDAAVTAMELDRTLSPNSDRLVVSGALAVGGTLQVVLGPGAPAPQAGDVHKLFSKPITGSFTNLSLPALGAGLSWVTSNLAVDGTISVAGTVSQPNIGSVTTSDGNIVISGTGGVEGATYHVLSATSVVAPIEAWLPIATNVFGAGGIFSYTNVVGTEPERYFRLVIPAP
jgi:autotransporter-associated beta strand protein